MSKLTPKQEMFCKEYVVDINATQAAIRCGYSEKTAEQQASRLLSNAKVAQRVQELMDKRSAKTEITAEKILKRLDAIGDVDISKAYDSLGHLLPIHEIPEDVRKCIASIKVFEEFEGFGKDRVKVGEVREVKFWDKIKANELLGKHKVLFSDRIEHTGVVTLEQLVSGSAEEKK